MTTSRISLCMIVRNEEALLPRFLQCARGLWDELIVVDTGSTDRTRDILRDAGARIFHHTWNDDFAAARNAGLEHAKGDWIVCLDADEMVSRDLVTAVRSASEDPLLGAATLKIRNQLEHGHCTITYLLRMFRRDASARFSYAIHEDVVTPVQAYLSANNLQVRRLGGEIEHLGYSRQRALDMDKKSRDLQLLRKCVEQDPHDLYSWFKMMEVARFWKDAALLADTAEQVAPLVREAATASASTKHFFGELLTLVAEGLWSTSPGEALAYLLPWRPSVAESASYLLRCGELNEAVGDVEAARSDYAACLGLKDVTANCQLASVRPLLGLARLALLRNDVPSALAQVDLALQENHRDPEALLALAALSLRVGGKDAANRVAQAYRDTFGDTDELNAAFREAQA